MCHELALFVQPNSQATRFLGKAREGMLGATWRRTRAGKMADARRGFVLPLVDRVDLGLVASDSWFSSLIWISLILGFSTVLH